MGGGETRIRVRRGLGLVEVRGEEWTYPVVCVQHRDSYIFFCEKKRTEGE
jgi:hypothetical protein